MRNLLLRLSVIWWSAGFVHAEERPNFTGKWVHDTSVNQSGELVTLTITDTPAVLTVERTADGQAERLSFSPEWLSPAQPPKDEVGGQTVVQEAKAAWHQGRLETRIARLISAKTVTQNIRYTMDPDGSHMTVEQYLQVHHGYENLDGESAAETYVRVAP